MKKHLFLTLAIILYAATPGKIFPMNQTPESYLKRYWAYDKYDGCYKSKFSIGTFRLSKNLRELIVRPSGETPLTISTATETLPIGIDRIKFVTFSSICSLLSSICNCSQVSFDGIEHAGPNLTIDLKKTKYVDMDNLISAMKKYKKQHDHYPSVILSNGEQLFLE